MLSGPAAQLEHLECVFFPSFGPFYPRPVVSAVTMNLLVTEVIKTCGSHARQIVSPAADKQG